MFFHVLKNETINSNINKKLGRCMYTMGSVRTV